MDIDWKELLRGTGILLGVVLFALGIAILESLVIAYLISFIFDIAYTTLLFKKVLAARIIIGTIGNLLRRG